jgi:hypothetical protein
VNANPQHVAADLIAAGEVVAAAPPNPNFDADAPSGHPNAREYLLPNSWQNLGSTAAALNSWRPGWALILVCSQHLAVVDIDTKHGANRDTEVARLTELGVPILGEARTPSGGAHIYVPATGLASTNSPARGIDTRGQALDGSGTGFVYLPGTQRPRYDGAGYQWVTVPDPAEAADYATDDTHDAMAAYLLAIGTTPRTRALHTEVADGEPLPDNVPSALKAMLSDLGPRWDIGGERSDDHSRRFHRLVGECHRYGLTQGQAVTALDPWCAATGRYTNRVAAEVARSWVKVAAAATEGGAA